MMLLLQASGENVWRWKLSREEVWSATIFASSYFCVEVLLMVQSIM
jgi:hypothetical protein